MNRLLWVCRCSGMEPYATNAFRGLFPGSPVPRMVKGRRDILRESLPPALSSLVGRLSKKTGRYAYLLEWDETTSSLTNLITGRTSK